MDLNGNRQNQVVARIHYVNHQNDPQELGMVAVNNSGTRNMIVTTKEIDFSPAEPHVIGKDGKVRI